MLEPSITIEPVKAAPPGAVLAGAALAGAALAAEDGALDAPPPGVVLAAEDGALDAAPLEHAPRAIDASRASAARRFVVEIVTRWILLVAALSGRAVWCGTDWSRLDEVTLRYGRERVIGPLLTVRLDRWTSPLRGAQPGLDLVPGRHAPGRHDDAVDDQARRGEDPA